MTTAYVAPGLARMNYGPRITEKQSPSSQAGGLRRMLTVPFTYDALPAALNSGNDAVNQYMPAGSIVTGCWLTIQTSFAGGTSYTVGFQTAAGVAIDVDGLIEVGPGAVANLVTTNIIAGRGAMVVEGPDAAGTAHIDGDGVYVKGATGPVTSVNAYPLVTAAGTFTAGAATLYIEYLAVGNGSIV